MMQNENMENLVQKAGIKVHLKVQRYKSILKNILSLIKHEGVIWVNLEIAKNDTLVS